MIDRVVTLSVPARDESGAYVGRLEVEFDDAGDPPKVVRDQHGTTWALVGGQHPFYRRQRCAEATYRVGP